MKFVFHLPLNLIPLHSPHSITTFLVWRFRVLRLCWEEKVGRPFIMVCGSSLSWTSILVGLKLFETCVRAQLLYRNPSIATSITMNSQTWGNQYLHSRQLVAVGMMWKHTNSGHPDKTSQSIMFVGTSRFLCVFVVSTFLQLSSCAVPEAISVSPSTNW